MIDIARLTQQKRRGFFCNKKKFWQYKTSIWTAHLAVLRSTRTQPINVLLDGTKEEQAPASCIRTFSLLVSFTLHPLPVKDEIQLADFLEKVKITMRSESCFVM